MKDVRKTPAYKAILPMIRKEDHKAFARAMQVMFERGEALEDYPFFGATAADASDVLLEAFSWFLLDGQEVPVVGYFWSKLHDEICNAERNAA